MSKVYRRCCGMDVHKETVVVCLLPPDGDQVRWFARYLGHFATNWQECGAGLNRRRSHVSERNEGHQIAR
jgi:hypothetical protein